MLVHRTGRPNLEDLVNGQIASKQTVGYDARITSGLFSFITRPFARVAMSLRSTGFLSGFRTVARFLLHSGSDVHLSELLQYSISPYHTFHELLACVKIATLSLYFSLVIYIYFRGLVIAAQSVGPQSDLLTGY
jgi:hypothetical protein